MKTANLGRLNNTLQSMDIYASKAISQEANERPDISNLAFGEPFFGPPEFLTDGITEDLTFNNFLNASKRYEDPRGSRTLREAIAKWYLFKYGFKVDPEREIIITHGGVEAIMLAILSVSEPGDKIAVTDPTYMLYTRAIKSLGRVPLILPRDSSDKEEYLSISDVNGELKNTKPKALIINSPENPSGYILSDREWKLLGERTATSGTWLIHDEVYDVMAFERCHKPVRTYNELRNRSIMINSFSKKFGLPGLRIGWLCAPPHLIDLAAKLHDYLCLGVNILFEKIAERIITHPEIPDWHNELVKLLRDRAYFATNQLRHEHGFSWPRKPQGAMFLFPNVRELHDSLPKSFTRNFSSAGEAVARYLLDIKKVAVVPGNVYGPNSGDNIRLVTCTSEKTYTSAIRRLMDLQ